MENEHFPEIGKISEVQQGKKRFFSSNAGHSKVKEASYRKVSVYTKSMEKYTRERERRRRVRVLAEMGFTQKQIAIEFGVSARTVKRDWDKIRSYVKGQTRREIMAVVDARRDEFERRCEGLTVNEELKRLKQDIKAAPKKVRAVQPSPRRQERQQQPIRQIDYTFDFDNLSADVFPRAIVPSEAHMRFSGEFVMTFWAIKNGEKRELCNIHMSTKNASPFH